MDNQQNNPTQDNQAVTDPAQTPAAPVTPAPTAGKFKVDVIKDKCIGCGSCEAIAPEVFKLDDEGKSVVVSQDGADDETKLTAAKSCPADAITVTDTETNQQLWPEATAA